MREQIADEDPRYRPAVVETEDGRWRAMVVLFDSLAHEEMQDDTAMIAWCDHAHRTVDSAERCVTKMRRIAKQMNREMLEVK